MSDRQFGSDAFYESENLPNRSPVRSAWSYESTVAEIEEIINRIELGELELAEIFDQFATAVDHLCQCETFLNQQQQKMDVLIETLLDEPEAF